MNNTQIFYRILIGVFIISFATFIYLMNVGIDERHEMKEDIQKLGEQHTKSEVENKELKTEIHVLTKENDSLKIEISNKTPTETSSTYTKPAGLKKYSVGTVSNTPNNQVIREIDNYLYAEGYHVLLGKVYNPLPDWLNKNPTVYYHSNKTKNLALIIASDLEDFSGIHFKTKRGKGEEVKPGKEDYTLFIHYSAPQQ